MIIYEEEEKMNKSIVRLFGLFVLILLLSACEPPVSTSSEPPVSTSSIDGIIASSSELNAFIKTLIEPITFEITPKGATGTFSIDPDIEKEIGLEFNSLTGEISGTPNKLSEQKDYSVTFNASGDFRGIDSATISISVGKNAVKDLGIIASSSESIAYIQTMMETNRFEITPKSATGTYSTNPDIEEEIGLEFNSLTGEISGKQNQ